MDTALDWEAVGRPDGHSWEIRRSHEGHEPALLGSVHVTDRGWIADANDGRSYGPFTSLSEAAYPLALQAEGRDARLFLGPPIPPPGSRSVRSPALAVEPPPRPRRNRNRLLSVALLAVTVLAVVAERRSARS